MLDYHRSNEDPSPCPLPARPGRGKSNWIKRWLANRVLNEQVLADVEKHTLVYPIDHGARVNLPEIEEEPTLFDGPE
jgi:hypothetical protein